MLITKTVTTKWNSKTKKYYEDLGYDFTGIGTELVVQVEHLKPSSKEKVIVKCDINNEGCKGVYEKSFSEYTKTRKNWSYDCCSNGKCRKEKAIITSRKKYGTDFPNQNAEVRNNIENTCKERYGDTNYFKTKDFAKKSESTNIKKYGVVNIFSSKQIQCKIKKTVKEKYGVEYISQNISINKKALETKKRKYFIDGRYTYVPNKEKHHNWKGGISEVNHLLRTSTQYKLWRKEVFERDSYICKCCKQYGGSLNAHHIEDWKNNQVKRFDLANGITLCEKCHRKFHKEYKSPNNVGQLTDFVEIHGKNVCRPYGNINHKN